MTTLSAVLLLAATAGAPADAALTADARCLALFAAKVGANEATNKFAQSAVMYYTGKLFERDSGIDLVRTLRESTVGMNEATETKRCLSEMQMVGEKLQAAGRALSKE